MEFNLIRTYRRAGEGVQNVSLFQRAWGECVELQQQDQGAWMARAILALQSLDRHEIGVFIDEPSPQCIAGIIIANDQWDAHVGPCCSVFTQYVLPEYRGMGISRMFIREALRIARNEGAKTLAYTHRVGPWKYSTTYRRINEDPES